MTGTIKINGVDRPAVDERCYELAQHFMSDLSHTTEDDLWQLAAAIQEAADGWIESSGKDPDRSSDLPEHVCGLQGYNPMIDPTCPVCSTPQSRRNSGENL